MNQTFEQRLDSVAWCDFGTAYGSAVNVPVQLRNLAGTDRKAAMNATHKLWCELCHQDVQVGSAALPALPFLLEVLDRADRDIKIELLDILLGITLGVNQQRVNDLHQSLDRNALPEERWLTDLRDALLAELPRFRHLATSLDNDVAYFAERILAELGGAVDAKPGTVSNGDC